MGNRVLAIVGGILGVALGHGLVSSMAGAGDGGRQDGSEAAALDRPRHGGFDLQVLVGGRPLPKRIESGERCVEAELGAEYELRLTNPLPERVAVAVAVDGLNVIDARHTSSWDASKWVIHPHETLTLSGWQVGSERARRFTFTTERDAYATRIGRPAEFGVISAVFYRQRRPHYEIVPHRLGEHDRVNSFGTPPDRPESLAERSAAGAYAGLAKRAPRSLMARRGARRHGDR